MQQWYLGFDCATKTFAFSLSRIALPERAQIAQLRARVLACRELSRRAAAAAAAGDEMAAAALSAAASAAAAELDTAIGGLIMIADGAVCDLAPGRPDAQVSTVERLRAVAAYVAGRIRPAIARAGIADGALSVVIEYQMGPNARARAVAAALVALFATDNVIIVGPSLKNKVSACADGRYALFAKQYSNSYGANKAHAAFNFARIEALFGTAIPPTKPLSRRGHIADSFMQVIGHLLFGADEKDAAKMF
jgi:hypothetical protein